MNRQQFFLFFILSVLSVTLTSYSQTYYISTIAGKDSAGFSGDGGTATQAKLYNPIHTVSDKLGNLYIADDFNNRVRKVDINGIISTIAGTGVAGNSGDGGPATLAKLNNPNALAIDDTGNLYICCWYGFVIRKVNTSGVISTVAGSGSPGFSGDGGTAINAKLGFPRGVALDDSANIYIADNANSCVRKVTVKTGIITTFAGIGYTPGYSGNGGPATSAKLDFAAQLALDHSGNMYIADYNNHVIRKVNKAGIISTYAGNGTTGFFGDGGMATSAQIHNPTGIAVDKAGNVYIADSYSHRIRKVDVNGIITTIAGTGTAGHTGDGGPALSAQLNGAIGVSVDTLGNIYVSEYSVNSDIRKLTPNCAVPLVITPPVNTPVCKGKSVTLTASGAISYEWVGTSNITNSITFISTVDTTYHLIADNGSCSIDTILRIKVSAPPSPSVDPPTALFCDGQAVKLTADGGIIYQWNPSTGLSASTGSEVFAAPSANITYTVTASSTEGCTANATAALTLKPTPVSSFSYAINGNQITFNSDGSTGGPLTYEWDFGDNTGINTQANPVHVFSTLDTFKVCLSVYNNSSCSFTLCREIDLLTGIDLVSAQLDAVQVYPNPAGNEFVVSGYFTAGSDLMISDLLGRILLTQNTSGLKTTIDVSHLPQGIYLLQVIGKNGAILKKFVKE